MREKRAASPITLMILRQTQMFEHAMRILFGVMKKARPPRRYIFLKGETGDTEQGSMGHDRTSEDQ